MSDGTTARADTSAINASDPSRQELEESIDQLAAYRDRLIKDVIGMGQRLKLPQKQVEFTLAQHPELQKLEAILAQLESQKSEQDYLPSPSPAPGTHGPSPNDGPVLGGQSRDLADATGCAPPRPPR